jgi:hypothetical protein
MPLRRLLVALAKARDERRGIPLEPSELIAAGWPGERLQKRTATNRLRVALHTLRRLGLEDLLLTQMDGYLLDPQVDLRIVE